MKRLFYLAVGAGAGIAAVRKATRAAKKLTPTGLAGSAGGVASGVSGGVRAFIDDVRFNMAEREIELHEAMTAEPQSPATGKRDGRSSS